MRLSRLPHSAAVHWGAVTLVGSVRTRDLYSRPWPIVVGSVATSWIEANGMNDLKLGDESNDIKRTLSCDILGYPRQVERAPDPIFDCLA